MAQNKYSTYKYKKLAKYFRVTKNGVVCILCPYNCTIKNNNLGSCRVRYAEDNKLFTLVYSNLCCISIEEIEKKPLYHFYPNSKILSVMIAGCSLKRTSDTNPKLIQRSPVNIKNYDISPEKLIHIAVTSNCNMIAYSYNDPTLYFEYILECSKLARKAGIKNVMISTGYINQKPLLELIPYLDAANIDLKSFNNETYIKLNGGTLQPVLDTIKTLKNNNVWVEISHTIIPEYTDNKDEIKEMCIWLKENNLDNLPIHFKRFFPIYKLRDVCQTKGSSLIRAKTIAIKSGIKHIYINSLDNDGYNNTYCHICNKLLIRRNRSEALENHIISGQCKYCNSSISVVF